LTLGSQNLDLLTKNDKEQYSHRTPSHAVDGDVATYFMSTYHAKINDSIMLDMMAPVGRAYRSNVEMVLVVNLSTADILSWCTFESSSDGRAWTSASGSLECHALPEDITLDVGWDVLECSISFLDASEMARQFRLTLARDTDIKERWVINEIWMRSKLLRS